MGGFELPLVCGWIEQIGKPTPYVEERFVSSFAPARRGIWVREQFGLFSDSDRHGLAVKYPPFFTRIDLVR